MKRPAWLELPGRLLQPHGSIETIQQIAPTGYAQEQDTTNQAQPETLYIGAGAVAGAGIPEPTPEGQTSPSNQQAIVQHQKAAIKRCERGTNVVLAPRPPRSIYAAPTYPGLDGPRTRFRVARAAVEYDDRMPSDADSVPPENAIFETPTEPLAAVSREVMHKETPITDSTEPPAHIELPTTPQEAEPVEGERSPTGTVQIAPQQLDAFGAALHGFEAFMDGQTAGANYRKAPRVDASEIEHALARARAAARRQKIPSGAYISPRPSASALQLLAALQLPAEADPSDRSSVVMSAAVMESDDPLAQQEHADRASASAVEIMRWIATIFRSEFQPMEPEQQTVPEVCIATQQTTVQSVVSARRFPNIEGTSRTSTVLPNTNIAGESQVLLPPPDAGDDVQPVRREEKFARKFFMEPAGADDKDFPAWLGGFGEPIDTRLGDNVVVPTSSLSNAYTYQGLPIKEGTIRKLDGTWEMRFRHGTWVKRPRSDWVPDRRELSAHSEDGRKSLEWLLP